MQKDAVKAKSLMHCIEKYLNNLLDEGMSYMEIRSKSGPRIGPWGTPVVLSFGTIWNYQT